MLIARQAWGPRQSVEAVEALAKKLLREDAQGRRTGLAPQPTDPPLASSIEVES